MSALGDSEQKVLTALCTKKKKITFLYPKKSLDIESDLKRVSVCMTAEAFCQSAFPKGGPFMLGSPIGRIQNHHVIFHTVSANPVVSFLPLLLIHIFFY